MKRFYYAVPLVAAGILGACSDHTPTAPQGTSAPIARDVAAPITGAVFTSDVNCNAVNKNLYALKTDVYVNGGPVTGTPMKAGTYWVQVTQPGGTVLGRSTSADLTLDGNGKVSGGCAELFTLVNTATSSFTVQGYDDTGNPGGVYIVAICGNNTFAPSICKYDMFKVTSQEQPEQGTLVIKKYFDADASGTFTAGDTYLSGWPVTILDNSTLTPMVSGSTTFTFPIDPGTYAASEDAIAGWINTDPGASASPLLTKKDNVVTAGNTTTVIFGNVCVGAGGGLTLGFWSNKNGQALLTLADFTTGPTYALNSQPFYQNSYFGGTGFGTSLNTDKSNLKSYLLNATATEMRYMLSAQAATMMLNVNHGYVSGGALVYAPNVPGANSAGFISITDLLSAAVAALPGSNRTLQETIKTALDSANNNLNFLGTLTQCLRMTPTLSTI